MDSSLQGRKIIKEMKRGKAAKEKVREDLSDSSGSPTSSCTADERRQRRMQQNRENSRTARTRKKHYIEFLEQQAEALSAEAEHLRKAAETAVPGYVDDSFEDAFDFCLRRLTEALADPLTSDKEFNAGCEQYLDLLGANGKNRMVTLSRTLEVTLELIFSKERLFWLWLSQCDSQHAVTIWSELSATLGLTPEQLVALQRLAFPATHEPVQSMVTCLKAIIANILRQSEGLQATILSLRAILAPRQVALIALWFQRRYRQLDPEKVLAYGCHSGELLR